MAKFTIVKLRTKTGVVYELGQDVNFHMGNDDVNLAGVPLSKITYLRTGYNKGYQLDGPVYLLTFDSTDIRKLIPQCEIEAIDIKKEGEAEETPSEAAVELPE